MNREACLLGAILREADLRGADLRGTKFRMADLTKVELGEAKWTRETVWPDYMISRLEQSSREEEPGIFIVDGGSADDRSGSSATRI